MELQLGLSLPTPPLIIEEGFGSNYNFFSDDIVRNDNKRTFRKAFDDYDDSKFSNCSTTKTLPLLWNDKNEDDDKNPAFTLFRNEMEEEVNKVVGWPPIKYRRKRNCCGGGGDRTVENGCGCGERVSNFMYVKVKMEGVGIARKVDLTLHSSFATLMTTLMNMFGRCHGDSENFKLTYQDREGDWLLAHDVPWRIFIRSVQRLKLQKNNH